MTTSRSNDLRALAQRIADAFPPEVIEVVVTGSVSRGFADELSDIEMLVVTTGELTLAEAFELAAAAGLEDRDSWGDPSTPTRRVHGYLDGQSVETIWWSRDFAEEHYDQPGSDQALLHGVALRTSGLLERWQEQLAVYPDELAAERIEKAAERWGGFSPGGLLTIARPDTALARAEWLVESAQRVLAIVYALNRERQPTSKRLARNTEALGIKPQRLAERIETSLAEPDPREALRLMTELQLETVQLAPSGPNVDRARTWLAAALELL
jgi:predicted nucleotidyltransferase